MAACKEAQRALGTGTLPVHLASHVQDCGACNVVARLSRQIDPAESPIVDELRRAWLTGGTVVAGRFEIEWLAGAGGMGAVYRARDLSSSGTVALKVLFGKSGADAGRFSREAGVLAELRHPAVTRYVAHGQTERGELYLAMEWLDGEDLSARLRRAPASIAEALEIVERAAAGLGAAHARGVVHRDVKPSNLFLVGGRDDSVKVLDFGIARTAASERWTKTGMILGTPGYMAPEQARGERDLDPRADVFALGCVLFEALTGRVAFPGSDVLSVLLKIVLEQPPRARALREDVPEDVDDLVASMLAKEPSERPATGSEAARQLGALRAEADVPRASTRARAAVPALTDRERRVTCVLLAREAPASGAAPTAAFLEDRERQNAVRDVLGGHGVRLDVLADGSIAITPARGGTATDVAMRLARCSLAIRPLLSDSPVSLAAGSAELSDGAPAGEVIDRGVTLLGSAPAGVVRIDDTTARLLGGRFDVQMQDGALALLGERESEAPGLTVLGRHVPCVGRDRELAALEAIFDECETESVAHAVVITGPAGVGKSRMRHELSERLASRERGVAVWVGRGDELTAGAPFGALASAIRNALGIDADDPLPVRRAALAERVAQSVVEPDRDRVCAFLGELVGTPMDEAGHVELHAARQDPMLMGDQMRRAWEDWLVAETARQPVLVVLEDFHWGDAPSARFVGSALKNLAERPWMVMAVARSETESLTSSWAGQPITRMELRALGKKASEELVRAALGASAAASAVARIVERGGGNAYYLEELVRAAAAGSLDAAPETVLGMVQARLEGLSDASRRALRAASVFGRSFRPDGVAALLGGADRALALSAALDDLVQREIVVRPTAAADAEHAFRNALVQEAAYAMLTDEDRLLGHRLAASWMESARTGVPIALAEHFDRGGEKSRAAAWYRRAAEQALEGNDLASALERVGRARACGAAGEELGLAALVEAQATKWRGDNERARSSAHEASSLLARGSPAWFRAIGQEALVTGLLGDHDALTGMSDDLAAVAVDSVALEACITAHVGVLMPLLLAGRAAAVGPLFERIEALVARDAALDPVTSARVAVARAWQALFAGDPGAYLARSEAAAELFQRGGDLRNACTQKVNAGYAHMELGAWADAERVLREALGVAERMMLSNLVAAAKHNLGLALARNGSPESGRQVEEEAAAAYRAQGDPRMEGSCRIYLALVAADAGDAAGAEREARAAVEILDGAPPARAQALAVLARALLALGRAADAHGAAVEAEALLESLGGIDEGEALVRLAFVESLEAVGKRDDAAAALAIARDRLLARAARIENAALRASFLERVPENAGTLARASR